MPDLTKYNTLITYLTARLRSTTIYNTFDRIVKYARRFLWITRIFRYIGIAVTIIETSAVLVIVTALLIVLVPLLFVVTAVFMIADLIIGARILKSKKLDEYLSRKQIYVFWNVGNFGKDFANELAEKDAAVFIVTADPSEKFVTQKEENGVYYIRHAFFFRLKRKKLNDLKNKLTYLL